ncbi:NADH-quinone oxidoreductase subunit F [Labeo rohita]|uniref:NADH-quinone oxidoreductase subunit F n=1 Tax=Labeo rohita TaxID=84645 RepID=A0ABQ8LQC0_LABRO|nr:NADH-quinone oxidoreductase subunit F [Labeo rohita]
MADLLTVYDDDQANSFIDCTKEDTLASQGEIPRPHPLPEWTDIREYLEYLDLDEPIIDHVTDDGKTVLKYKCRMCVVEMDLYSMVAHIVGRKHRQKYLELKRPDLVTWQDNNQKQPGLVARAKAAVVEKQEGWGKPVALKRPQEKFRNVFQGSDLRASVHEQPYYGQDSLRKPPFPEKAQKQTYLDEDRKGRPFYAGDKYDQYSRPNTSQIRQQFYPEENRQQKPYEDAEVRGRLPRGDDYPEREMHIRPYADQGGRTLREDYEESLGGGQFSGSKINRFNDKDLRIHPGASEYQTGEMEGRRYPGYEERNPAMNPMSMPGRSFNEEKRGTVREMHSRTWDKANEVQGGYPPMLKPRDPRTYVQEEGPTKKKKKSRFSDATAEEIAFVHMRGGPFRANPLPSNNQYVDSGSTSHFNPKHENVLDILNDIKIDNMDEARFLKEKLCSVLKEFQESKSRSAGGHTSQPVSDHRGVKQTDQRRDAYNDPRNDPDGMHLEKRGFQQARQYEDSPRSFQEPRQYGDDPRMFRDDSRGQRETRRYEDDYEKSNRFDSYPSGHQEARPYASDARGIQKTILQENPRDLPERRRYDEDPRQKGQHFEEYSRAEATRSTQETRYYKDDYRGFGNVDPERNWEHEKGRSLERFENRGPADVKRGFQESFSKPPVHFQPTSLQEEARIYAGRAQQRSHPNDGHPGDEPYDPFNPSSSPPPEASSSTSLDKIASTLLELVARR